METKPNCASAKANCYGPSSLKSSAVKVSTCAVFLHRPGAINQLLAGCLYILISSADRTLRLVTCFHPGTNASCAAPIFLGWFSVLKIRQELIVCTVIAQLWCRNGTAWLFLWLT